MMLPNHVKRLVTVPADRQRQILDSLRREGQVSATALAKQFDTSEDTIRRDLRDFAAQGLCQRVYGGAVLLSASPQPLSVRVDEDIARKHALAMKLLEIVRPRQFLFLDAGSTNVELARLLPKHLSLRVATHSPVIASALVGKEGIELLVIGGNIHPVVGAALGASAMQEIAKLHPDLLLLGACSLNVSQGIGAFDYEDVSIKRTLMQNAGAVALAVLSEKLRAVSSHTVAAVEALSDIVVEHDAPVSEVNDFLLQGIRIHRAMPTSFRD